jgi:hypothetical protein
VTDVINQLTAQGEALKSGWQTTQEKINAQVQLAKQIVGESSSAAPPSEGATTMPSATVAQKAAEINRLAGDIKQMRGDAQSKLDSAIKLFNDAYKAAEEVRISTRKKMDDDANQNRPERDAWKKLIEVMDSQYYRLREASAQRMLASLYASEAASLRNRINLKAGVVPTIERAGADVPTALQPANLDKDYTQAVNLADEAYKAADEILTNILEGTAPKETKDAGKVERILVLYGWAQVDKMGEKGKEAEAHLQQSVAIRNDAAQEQIRLPALPAELGTAPAPTPPTPEPTTQPTDTATTEPAGEEGAAKAAITAFADAFTKADLDGMKAAIHVEPGQEEQLQHILDLTSALAKFREVSAKFGGAAEGMTQGLQSAMTQMKNLKVTIDGDNGMVDVPGVGPQKKLVKVDGKWKLYLGPPEDEASKAQAAMIPKFTEALKQINTEIENGTIANQEQLAGAFMKMMASMQQGGAGGAPPP